MNFKLWLEGRVIVHVSGASGSGKTTLADELSDKYPDVVFKDLDDFDDQAEKILNYKKDKKDYTDEMLKQLAETRQKLMDEFINSTDKPIVLVGHHTEGDHVLKIPTKNRIMLDVDAKTSARRAYKRSQKESPRHRRTLDELPADEKEAQDVIDFLLKNGYKPLSYEKAKEWVARQLKSH